MVSLRVFFLSLSMKVASREIPLGYLRQRGHDVPRPAPTTEVAPGVRMALMGTGDFLLPDGTAGMGALVSVWRDEEAGRD